MLVTQKKLLTSSSEGGTNELELVLLRGSDAFGCSSEDDDGKKNELVELEGEGDTEGEDDNLFANEIYLLNCGIWHL